MESKRDVDFIFWRKYGDSDYLISSNGKIYNTKLQKFFKTRIQHGYIKCSLSINKKEKEFRVHRLVAELFIPNPEGKKIVNHIDGNKLNNNFSNLEWCTHKENTNHAINSGLKVQKSLKPNIIKNYDLTEGKQISDYPNYYIFPDGRIYNAKTKILLRTFCKADGYPSVGLSKDNKCKLFFVHVLVAKMFIQNTENKSIVNHKDGDKKNYDISNLEWTTVSENCIHALNTGLNNCQKGVIQYDLNFNEIARYKSIREASRKTKIHYGNISQVCLGKGKTKTAGGYIWRHIK